MRMARRSPIKIWTKGTITYDSEGNKTYTWSSADSFADFQPVGNKVKTSQDFGKDTIAEDSRIVFGEVSDLSTVTINSIVENLYGISTGNRGPLYTVVGIAPWYRHTELLVEPWKGAVPS